MKSVKGAGVKKATAVVGGYCLILAAVFCAGCSVDADTGGGRLGAILTARAKGVKIAPPSGTYGDISIAEAYKVQDELTRKLTRHLGRVTGYKVAYASKAAQARNNIGEPVSARLFARQQVGCCRKIRLSDFAGFAIEAEVAMTIARDITAEITDTAEISIKKYVKSVHVAFDICDRRIKGPQAAIKPADVISTGGGAHRYVLSDPVDPDDADLAKITLRLERNSKKVYEGSGGSVMGGPYKSLTWLSNHLISRGLNLKAGDIVLTGAVDRAYQGDGDDARGEYIAIGGSVLGGVAVTVE